MLPPIPCMFDGVRYSPLIGRSAPQLPTPRTVRDSYHLSHGFLALASLLPSRLDSETTEISHRRLVAGPLPPQQNRGARALEGESVRFERPELKCSEKNDESKKTISPGPHPSRVGGIESRGGGPLQFYGSVPGPLQFYGGPLASSSLF
ncbi:hypothetical protein SUGI_1517780 [Cryptomeria japonica]|uniref:Uncharacterized protein n=1 Tax=Cryptomeria japonica TaxID=3369 RepID=A0AAD3RRU9_CRYJA|nr:hypothetical protein SUGI_1503160 [Cryptomeria japonica]GLJ59651.1 hypothetical protein SUGI_1517780 [Cryptomeria japonica]